MKETASGLLVPASSYTPAQRGVPKITRSARRRRITCRTWGRYELLAQNSLEAGWTALAMRIGKELFGEPELGSG